MKNSDQVTVAGRQVLSLFGFTVIRPTRSPAVGGDHLIESDSISGTPLTAVNVSDDPVTPNAELAEDCPTPQAAYNETCQAAVAAFRGGDMAGLNEILARHFVGITGFLIDADPAVPLNTLAWEAKSDGSQRSGLRQVSRTCPIPGCTHC